MERKLRTKRGRDIYRKRGQTVEPVFGQHVNRGLDRFILPREEGPAAKWSLFSVCLEILGQTQSPDAVISRLERAISELHAGDVDFDRLVERNRVSKPVEAYTQYTQNVAALERARDQDLAVHPGQDVEYVVVDDEKASRERVALAHEETDQYDPSYYESQLVRAVESVVSPLGWSRSDIRRRLAKTRTTKITSF